MENETVDPHDTHSIGNSLETLNLSFSFMGLGIEIDWFRMLRQRTIPNELWHSHSGTEIHFLLEGSNRIEFENQMVTLSAGEMLLIPKSRKHRISNPGNMTYLRYVLNVSLNAESCLESDGDLCNFLMLDNPLQFKMPEEIVPLLEQCHMEAEQKEAGFTSIIRLTIMQILLLLGRALTDYTYSEQSASIKRSYSSKMVERVIDYINSNVIRNLTVSDVAETMFISSKHLQRIVKKECRCTVKDLIVNARLQMAKEKLKNTQMTIGEIAETMDFSSEQSFCRFFRNAEGQSPNQYRKGSLGER